METKQNYSLAFIIGVVLCWLVPSSIWASVQVDGISYNLSTSAKTAEVVPGGYRGTIDIPASFIYNGDTYSVTSIGYQAFYNCTRLTSVTIPNSVTDIGVLSFEGCTSLTSVDIPNSVTSIGDAAFEGCTGLTSIEIPNSVTSIGNLAFYGCTGLTTIEIPNSVTNIGSSVFSGCTGLTSMEIPNSVTSIDEYVFEGCTGLTTIEIPNSVTSIGYGAFNGCTGLTSIEIPKSVTSIGGSAFSGTPWYENQPDGLVYAGKNAYKYKGEMPQGTAIVLEEGTLSICDDTFYECLGLTSIEIPNSVTSISGFSGCTGLTSIEIPNSVTSIGWGAFYGCTGLTSVEIPNSVTSIGEYAFNGCTGLTTIEIPNSVTSIGDFTFCGCTGLTSVTIPNSVTSIGECAFALEGLTSIIANGAVPPDIHYDYDWDFGLATYSGFSGVDKTNCILYVPVGSKSAYESAGGWSEFQNIVEFEPDTDISSLDNAIYVEETEARIGGTMDIPVKLKNSYPVRGFQFKLELPEGATINSWALSSGRMPSGATESDKIATQKIDGNTIAIACSLNYGDATFTGSDGEIATVNVTFGENMEEGRYPIYLTGCDVTTADGVDEDLSDIKATLVLEDYLPGDANGDGKVRIGDATAILNYIVGNVSNNFQMKAADTNGDGRIRIGDATAVLNLIVNQL